MNTTDSSPVQQLLAHAVKREPTGEGKGYSGALLERVTLADGRLLILKQLFPATDMTIRLTHDRGRAATLWLNGIFDQMPPLIEHATLAAEANGDGWLLVMRDVAGALLRPEQRLSGADNRRFIKAMLALHRTFDGQQVPDLCSLNDYLSLLTPTTAARPDLRDVELMGWLRRGWELFFALAPADVGMAVEAILAKPERLAQAMAQRPMTLVHGDLYLHNIGWCADRVVMIDWSLATQAPSALDFTTYLAMNGLHLDITHDQAVDDFRRLSGAAHDEPGLQLSLIAGLVAYGWRMALFQKERGGPAIHTHIEAELNWWLERTRYALNQVWSPY